MTPPGEPEDPGYTYIKWVPSPDSPGVVEIVLNRPRIHNALNRATYAELDDAFGRAGSSDAVRAVLLRGEGKSFCADVERIQGRPPRPRRGFRSPAAEFR